jgi:hypothetical protein
MIDVLRETHDAPDSVERRLRLAGGINRYGEPNFRAVWGWSRLTWVGGRWEDRDAPGNLIREVVELRQVPKYVPFDRWHIERWVPPEVYGSPQQWYAQTIEVEGSRTIPALGPYPARGEYELCFTLEGPRGEFVPLTAMVAEAVARLIELSRSVPAWSRKAALFEREAQAEREFDRWAYDVLDDAVPALRGLPFISVPATLRGVGASAPTSWVGKTGFSPSGPQRPKPR